MRDRCVRPSLARTGQAARDHRVHLEWRPERASLRRYFVLFAAEPVAGISAITKARRHYAVGCLTRGSMSGARAERALLCDRGGSVPIAGIDRGSDTRTTTLTSTAPNETATAARTAVSRGRRSSLGKRIRGM